MWQLRFGSTITGSEQDHKCTNRPVPSHLPPPIPAKPGENTWVTSYSTALLAASCKGQHWNLMGQNPITHHISPQGWCPETGGLVTEGIPTSPGNMGHFPWPHRDPESFTKTISENENLHFTIWKTKESPLLLTC